MDELHERNASGSGEDHAHFARAWAELALGQPAPPREVFACQQAPYAFFLESERGEIAAYALCRGYGTRGDVRQIVVMPGWRGRGVGRQLMAAVAARLGRAGCQDWRLEVKADNQAAIALYRAVGMAVRRPLALLHLDAATLGRLTAAIAPPRAHTITAADDDACEQAFDLGRGFLAGTRARRPDLASWRVDDEHGRPLGLARWIPDHSDAGALLFPFRARSGAAVAAVLAAALPGPGPRAVPVELLATDAGVADALCAAGAVVREPLLEMGGVLPGASRAARSRSQSDR